MYGRISEEPSYYIEKNYMSIRIMWNEIKKTPSFLRQDSFLKYVSLMEPPLTPK